MKQPNEARRLQLIRVAARLFREKGYERTTVRDLAAAVGLQSGSLFHHFDTKEAILFAVIEEAMETSIRRLDESTRSTPDPKSKMRALIRTELENLLGETKEGLSVAFFEWRSLNEDHQTQLDTLYQAYNATWQLVLEEANASKHLPINPKLLRRFLRGALNWSVAWFQEDGYMDLDELAEEALNMFWRDGQLDF